MSFKITIEVDGQTEQQLSPLLSRVMALNPEQLMGADTGRTPDLSSRTEQSFYAQNAALLQQQIQQLSDQNQRLQTQVADSQRLLAGEGQARLPEAVEATRAITTPAVAIADYADAPHQPPPLPVQYQSDRSEIALYRLRHTLIQLPARCWQTLIWLSLGRQWLLLFLLLCGGMYGVLTFAPKLAERLWSQPEFVDSTEASPGTAATPESSEEKPPESSAEKPPKQTSSTSPTSKAGSHPPPPPAFQQQ